MLKTQEKPKPVNTIWKTESFKDNRNNNSSSSNNKHYQKQQQPQNNNNNCNNRGTRNSKETNDSDASPRSKYKSARTFNMSRLLHIESLESLKTQFCPRSIYTQQTGRANSTKFWPNSVLSNRICKGSSLWVMTRCF